MNNQEYVRRINIQQSGLFHKRKPFLTQLDIELTERCNNNCVHCYINLPENCEKSKKKELSTSQWKEIIKESSELGSLSIRFTGGEPLLRDDFIDLYLFTRSLGIKVVLFTNARLITKELAELLRKTPPLEKIEVSIYGMHPESNRQITSSNSGFKETQRGLQLLLQHQKYLL